ncbi:MAG: inositol-3-phosphate synthase [Nitrososphaeria archaeon]|nr:inositol-3-phosphate synthase [Nitrososphaeria archaeon]NIN52245.1 inositol-3-phosphate synthase [Nitrososphaeria archaeon]NIQ32701.1 inositol-3-phosphate synthase [Nitrososphaeria archaeon]
MREIRVGVVGVGNLCSALLQGIEYYKHLSASPKGLAYSELGGYWPGDIQVVAAVDIDERKVGRDLSEAVFSAPNVIEKLCDVPRLGVKVAMGEVLDGLDDISKGFRNVSSSQPKDIAPLFREMGVEIVVNMVPSGSQRASEWYAEKAIETSSAFVNVTPSYIASQKSWVERFRSRGIPVVGDDLMDQVGSTILHKAVLRLLHDQGAHIGRTYSLDVGGGAENLASLSPSRKRVKREIKSRSIGSILPYEVLVTAGTTDFIDFMGDRRESHIKIDGTYFMEAPFHIDIKMETHDSINGAGMLIDVIRAVKIALEREISGLLPSVTAYAFKTPSNLPVAEARSRFEEFIRGERER